MSTFKSGSLMVLGVVLAQLFAATAQAQSCKAIHADLIETRVTEGCDPGLASCFVGSVNGNHGLRGATHFNADSVAAGPSTGLEGFISYSGRFQYRTAAGSLIMRETGVTNSSEGLPQSGAVTAYQHVVEGTGVFAGATGFLFVSGRNTDGVIETRIFGEICFAG